MGYASVAGSGDVIAGTPSGAFQNSKEEEVWFEQTIAYNHFDFLGHHESESEVAQSCPTLW